MYISVKYKDDGREFVTVLEFITIHCTFPALNAWLTYQLLYQTAQLITASCPYSQRLNPPYFYCTKGLVTETPEQYNYNCVRWFGFLAYFIITCENMIYLAYYKDVMFCLCVILEFSSMFYWSETFWTQPQLNQTQKMVVWMIALNVACLLTTLIANFNSAFYLKARQMKRKLQTINENKTQRVKVAP
jgi:hypothetical protein